MYYQSTAVVDVVLTPPRLVGLRGVVKSLGGGEAAEKGANVSCGSPGAEGRRGTLNFCAAREYLGPCQKGERLDAICRFVSSTARRYSAISSGSASSASASSSARGWASDVA